MRGLRFTLFALAFVSLTAELIRHGYVRFVESHQSVLDEYDALRTEIKEATSLEALRKRYAEELDKEKAREAQQPSAPGAAGAGAPFPGFRAQNPESPVFKLRQAITEWEQTENQIRELWFFWGAGVLCLLLAVVCHWRGAHWLSTCLQAAGFAEMTWWTTPSFTLGGAVQEFSRLLDNKLVFTTVALELLLTFWATGVLRPRATREREVA